MKSPMADNIKELLHLYRVMLTIRRFEERVVIDYRSGAIPGIVHSYIGQEAVATAGGRRREVQWLHDVLSHRLSGHPQERRA